MKSQHHSLFKVSENKLCLAKSLYNLLCVESHSLETYFNVIAA